MLIFKCPSCHKALSLISRWHDCWGGVVEHPKEALLFYSQGEVLKILNKED